ncbi:MAG TPA: AraC family transcriptional regulator [Rugosimonospora sp.]|nr:AraC family transcriptional regulator [Rugosimonospora sp.]
MDAHGGQLGTDAASDRRAAVQRAIVAMRAGLGRPQPLTALAKNGLFSPFYFHRIFRDITGLTPARFLAALRMAEARRLLRYSRLPVNRIGERVGYTSPGTFGTQFGRLVGLSPARFRTLVRSLGDERVGGWLPVLAHASVRRTGATMALSGVPAAESLVVGRLYATGGAGDRGLWALGTGSGNCPVRLPEAPHPGEYAVLAVAVPGGVRLADVLVERPGSYLLGRAQVSLTAREQSAARVHTILRWPELTDPPTLAITPLDWLVPSVA